MDLVPFIIASNVNYRMLGRQDRESMDASYEVLEGGRQVSFNAI
jgi:hypothetical protein